MDLKKYMNKDLIEEKLYQVKDQFNQKKITLTKFHSILVNKIHPFNDGNGRTCKILLDNDNKINLLMRRKLKTNNIK